VVGAERSALIEAGIMGLAESAAGAASLLDDLVLPIGVDQRHEARRR
jgi:hypothetical protein